MAPITPLTYEILLALADEPRHGYGIIKEIEERSGAASAPSTGALYLALQRMRGSGLIEEVDADDPSEDARRRYYRLSRTGRARAEEESLRLERLVSSAREKRLLTGEAT